MIDTDVRGLVEQYETAASGSLRLILSYDGDEYEPQYVRDDVDEMYSPEEFDEKLKQLVVEGISDPPSKEQFRQFGETEVVIRRFAEAIMIHYPMDEFAGVGLTFDRDAAPALDELADIGYEFFHGDDDQ